MTVRQMPKTSARIVNDLGLVIEPWVAYLRGVETDSGLIAAQQIEIDEAQANIVTLQGRVSVLVADLPTTPTNDEIATAFNDLLAKLKAAGLMETT